MQIEAGKAARPRRTVPYVAGSADRSPTTACAKYRLEKCPRQDSNLYAVSGTGPSNQPVYQFQHVGHCPSEPDRAPLTAMAPCGDRTCSGRDSNPHGVNPHRVLNPARLPIPPPELRTRSPAVTELAEMEPRGIEPLTS